MLGPFCPRARIRAEGAENDAKCGSQGLLCIGFNASWCCLERGTTRASADQPNAGQVIGALGGTYRLGLHHRDQTFPGHMPFTVRHPGEAWSTSTAGHRFARRALRVTARRRAGICGGLSGILLRANLRGAARTRHHCL